MLWPKAGMIVAPPGVVPKLPNPVLGALAVAAAPNGLAFGAAPAVAEPNVKFVAGAVEAAGWPNAGTVEDVLKNFWNRTKRDASEDAAANAEADDVTGQVYEVGGTLRSLWYYGMFMWNLYGDRGSLRWVIARLGRSSGRCLGRWRLTSN